MHTSKFDHSSPGFFHVQAQNILEENDQELVSMNIDVIEAALKRAAGFRASFCHNIGMVLSIVCLFVFVYCFFFVFCFVNGPFDSYSDC